MNKNISAHNTAQLSIEPVSYKAPSPGVPHKVSLKTIFIHQNISTVEAQQGHSMMNRNDCYSCHGDFKTLAAPSYIDIATKYKNDPDAITRLARHIILGSRGIWEDREMKSHPELLQEDAQKMVKYILSLASKNDPEK